MIPVEDRFFRHVVVNLETGCWNWASSKTLHGYGTFNDKNYKTTLAHRWSFLHFVGDIPNGREIDHLCRNRACVNWKHMELITHRENLLRGNSISTQHAKQTHCINGHEFTVENTILRKAGRDCRICHRLADKASKNRRKEAMV